MATHSSVLAVKIPWTEEPVELHAVHGVQRVGHDRAHTQIHTRLRALPPLATSGSGRGGPHLQQPLGNHSPNKHGTGGEVSQKERNRYRRHMESRKRAPIKLLAKQK